MSDIIFKDVSLTKRAPAWKFFYSNEDKKLAKCQVDNCSKVINWKNGLSGLSNHTQLYRFFKFKLISRKYWSETKKSATISINLKGAKFQLKKGLLDGGIATPAEKKVLIISKIAWKQSF